MSNDAFLRLFEAVMEQAYKDAKSTNEELALEAQSYIDDVKRKYA